MIETTAPNQSPASARFFAILLALLAALMVWTTMDDYGLVIDEATYLWAAEEVREWFRELATRGPAQSLSDAAIAGRWHFLEDPASRPTDRHSNFNLPAACHVTNLGWLFVHRLVGDELYASRVGTAAVFAICVGVTCSVVSRRRSPAAGLFAAAAIVLSPRIFGHAHLACTETPLACFWTLALLTLVRAADAETRRGQAVAAVTFALTCGLTTATKLTGWLMVGPVLLWLAAVRPRRWPRLVAVTLVAPPLVTLAVTPNVWHDPIGRTAAYLQAAVNNPWKITSFYLGSGYQDELPWHSALVLTATTMPVSLLLLAAVGSVAGVRNRLAGLFALNAATILTARCVGLGPAHDGERQFLPLFYFLAVLAALGVDEVVRLLAWVGKRRSESPNRLASPMAEWAVALVCSIEPAWDWLVYRSHGLSYYNCLVGGLPGAAARGMEISYWFEAATDKVWTELHSQMPANARIFIHPDHPGLEILRRRGFWPNGLRSTGPTDADYWLLYAKRAAYVMRDAQTPTLRTTDLLLTQERGAAVFEEEFLGVRLLALVKRPSVATIPSR
jgi:hypothetical protein